MNPYILIYTDGACSGNPGPAGVGILFQCDGRERQISRFIGNHTNNIAELTAIKIALESINVFNLPVRIYSDSKYAIGVITKDWKIKANIELINSIKEIKTKFNDIDFIYVEGHAGNPGNEKANELATKAVETKLNTDTYSEPAIKSEVVPIKQTICFYHKDQDGFCSAAIVARKFPDCNIFKAITYTDKVPFEIITPNAKVIIVDFSFKPHDLTKIMDITKDIIWIDHHKTAMEATPFTPDELPGIRVDGTAACILSWNYFFNGEPLPKSVAYAGDYDIWKFEFENTRNFYHGLESIDYINKPNSKEWQALLNDDDETEDLVQKGIPIREAFDKDQNLFIKTAGFRRNFEGYRAVCANRYMHSDLFYDIFDFGFDLIIMFYYNGKDWVYSLRSKTIDVSAIAKKYGGGGHVGSAGFHLKKFILGDPQ